MCGIVGYTGSQAAAPILLDGLKKLEYRGYDSAGIAVLNDNLIAVSKVTGRIANLCERTADGKNCPGTVGIGHTRWATHGAPTDTNAHPHMSNIVEVKARGAEVLAVTFKDNQKIVSLADDMIYVPKIETIFTAAVEIVLLQLLAYYVAKENGCDIDKPKNLAKSVTVE